MSVRARERVSVCVCVRAREHVFMYACACECEYNYFHEPQSVNSYFANNVVLAARPTAKVGQNTEQPCADCVTLRLIDSDSISVMLFSLF